MKERKRHKHRSQTERRQQGEKGTVHVSSGNRIRGKSGIVKHKDCDSEQLGFCTQPEAS